MTEEEKRLKALAFMAQEQTRLSSRSPLDAVHADLASSLRRAEARRQSYAALEQHGLARTDGRADL